MAKKQDKFVQKTFRITASHFKTIKEVSKETSKPEAEVIRTALDKGLDALKITEVAEDGYVIMLCELSEANYKMVTGFEKFGKMNKREVVNRIIEDYFKGK